VATLITAWSRARREEADCREGVPRGVIGRIFAVAAGGVLSPVHSILFR
jgi:hypothetical protein